MQESIVKSLQMWRNLANHPQIHTWYIIINDHTLGIGLR